ncbi:ATP-dependent DNA helicase PIF1-like [Uloborus diversus]|uniref:ATP-dependent DNA helicase PIF1-like n=1 Tax=Uloborus diversus TaxID=327109 RepID=UPI002409CA85|nr:ATP-dependent DNA helicase PIF1-like [Uloborus diversus]
MDNCKIEIRNVTAVVRVPYFVASTDPENFYYSLLLQYMPYRSEQELLEGFNSSKEAFLAREEALKRNSEQMEEYRERDRQLENAFNQAHAFEILDAEPLELQEDVDEEVLEQQIMDDIQFQNAVQAMNLRQKDIFKYITSSIQDQLGGSQHRERLFITGQAGTGKTFLFNLLKNQVNRCYAKPVVKVCALTGVAARLVGGSTLHNSLKLPVQKDGRIVEMPLLTGIFLQTMRRLWTDIEFFFIDEISMVPYEMLCMIDSRLRQLKNTDNFFGGLNILVFGDLMQLPPVRGRQIFQQPEHMIPATDLWKLFSLVELVDNMRQQGDMLFVDLLNALRIGELSAQHMAVLLERESSDMDGEFSIERALRIYPTNKQVDEHNNRVLQYFRSKNTSIYKIRAQDQLIDATKKLNENTSIDSIISKDINKTGGLPRELEIFVGAKVMLRANIDVTKGLVNGAIGFVKEIVWPYFRRAQVYAEDIPSVLINFGKDGIHKIEPKSIQFPALYSYGNCRKANVAVDFVVGFNCT